MSSQTIFDQLEHLVSISRALDLRRVEGQPTQLILDQVHPEVVTLLKRSIDAVQLTLSYYDDGDFASQPPPRDELTYDRDLDRLVALDASRKQIADLAFVVLCELRQRSARTAAADASMNRWEVIDILGSARRRIIKSLSAIAKLIAALKGYETSERFATELESSLQVRVAYARLRRVVKGESRPTDAILLTRLRAIGTQIAILVGRDLYGELRVADRARIRELQQRILAWLRANDSEDAEHLRSGHRIWQDVFAFSEFLRQVNRRAELLEHDSAVVGRLLLAHARERHGDRLLTAAQLEAARALEGLEDAIDRLIGSSERRWWVWQPALSSLVRSGVIDGAVPSSEQSLGTTR